VTNGKSQMNKSRETFLILRIILIPLLFILICVTAFYLYERHYGYFITAKFSESGPLYKNMPVFYKGYKIGKTRKIILSKDYKSTLVIIKLFPENPKLPEDIVAKVKKQDSRADYIDLLPPDEPSAVLLKKGSIIDGEPAFDLDAFLSDIADSGLIVPLLQTFSDTLLSLNKTSVEIGNFFKDSRVILKDNRQNIKQSTKDLAQTTKGLTKLTSNLNTSISKDRLENTSSSVDKSANNILSTTQSVKNIAASVDCATRNLDKTMAKLDCTISEVNAVASNVKVITKGIKETMCKKFAGARMIFGKPLKDNDCCKDHCP